MNKFIIQNTTNEKTNFYNLAIAIICPFTR